MGLKRVSWVRRYQGQCRALRPLGHQGYRLRSYKKDQPLCSGYMCTDWNHRVVEDLDWNIRGRSGPGLERPGLHKDKEAAAARRTCTRARDGGEGEHEEQE